MADITNPKLLYLKAALFLVTGLLSALALLIEVFSLKNLCLLALTIWCFSRAYYFAFYVVQHYIDPSFRFAGLTSVLRHLLATRPSGGRK
jgi:hypothetical protein